MTRLALPTLSLRDGLLVAAADSLISHLIFNRYEPQRLVPVALLLGVLPILPTLLIRTHFATIWGAAVAAFSTFYTTLALSIISYRLSPFHPLAKYPGPSLAKVSKWWGVWVTAHGKQHIYYQKLHQKYGPYVRVGPNELSFLDVDVVIPITAADMPKSSTWDGRQNPDWVPNLIGLRSSQEHARRRKNWNRAFSTQAVKDYEPIMINRALQLADELERRCGGGAVDLANWISFFTFDFMGDMAYGGGFELMREGDKEGYWKILEAGMRVTALFGHIPWAIKPLLSIPLLSKDGWRIYNFAVATATNRRDKGSHMKDVFHHLMDEAGVLPERERPSFEEAAADGVLTIVAGSDTTATVVNNLFYNLLTHPEEYARLRAEVDAVFPLGEGDPFDSSKLAAMPYLNAVINESMRLQPPVASGSQRSPERGTGSRMIGNHLITEGTTVFVPTYALHRDPRYFSPSPDRFWPDRWILPSQSSADRHEKAAKTDVIVTNHAAFVPFSTGPANCAGKNLALLEMRAVVSLLLQRFDMRLDTGYDPKQWIDDLEDWFVLTFGKLPVVLTPRKF